jgi:hypothetical protein
MNARIQRVFQHFFDDDRNCYEHDEFCWIVCSFNWHSCGIVPIMKCPESGEEYILYSNAHKLFTFCPDRDLRRVSPVVPRLQWDSRSYKSIGLHLGLAAEDSILCERWDHVIKSFDPYLDSSRNDACLIAARCISIETRGLICIDPNDLRRGRYRRVILDDNGPLNSSIIFFVDVPWDPVGLANYNRIAMQQSGRRRLGKTISMFKLNAVKASFSNTKEPWKAF